MSRCKALSAARCVALVVLGAWLVGCGSDTTVVIASGTGNPQTDRSGGLVVAVRSGDPPPFRPAVEARAPPPPAAVSAAPPPAPEGPLPAPSVPALGRSAQALAALLLVWIGARRRGPRRR